MNLKNRNTFLKKHIEQQITVKTEIDWLILVRNVFVSMWQFKKMTAQFKEILTVGESIIEIQIFSKILKFVYMSY